jgi:hypothetical protein
MGRLSRTAAHHRDAPLVLGGFLYSHKDAAKSRRQITSFFVPGDIADLPAFYLPKVTTISKRLVQQWSPSCRTHHSRRSQLEQVLWREALMQAAIYQEWIVNLGRRDAIAVGLARDLSFSMPWTQMDVADASGISNVHANRVIQELRQLGLVEWDSKQGSRTGTPLSSWENSMTTT